MEEEKERERSELRETELEVGRVGCKEVGLGGRGEGDEGGG